MISTCLMFETGNRTYEVNYNCASRSGRLCKNAKVRFVVGFQYLT